LHATPEPSPAEKRAADHGYEREARSRLESWRRARNSRSWTPAAPPIMACRHLLDHLFEVGPSISNGMGQSPLPPPYIRDWANGSGIPLTEREFRWLCRLSSDYVNESAVATRFDAPEPWDADERIRATELQRQELAKE
jgi:hypothetical protein